MFNENELKDILHNLGVDERIDRLTKAVFEVLSFDNFDEFYKKYEELKKEADFAKQVKTLLSKFEIVKETNNELLSKLYSYEQGERKTLNSELEEKREKIKTLNNDLEKKKDEIKTLNSDLEEKKDEIKTLNSELEEKREKIKTLNSDLEAEQCKTSELESELLTANAFIKEVNDETAQYKSLLKDLLECSSLKMMVEDYGLDGEDMPSVIRFINLLGNMSTFLDMLHQYMEWHIEEDKSFIDEQDKKFYENLNKFYKEKFPDCAPDLIVYKNANDSFDENYMVDIDKPNDFYRRIEGIYIPGIRRLDSSGSIKFMQKVRGIK